MIKLFHLCSFFMMNVYWHEAEIELYRSEKIIHRAFLSHATGRDFELAAQEIPIFERSLEKFLESKRSKNARGLLTWVECDRITNGWMEDRLQAMRMKIEEETIQK